MFRTSKSSYFNKKKFIYDYYTTSWKKLTPQHL